MTSKNILNKKLILKNSAYLGVRSVINIIVSLYTSRIVLQILGAEDYGIYSLVYSLVGVFYFLSNSMSSATQMFLSKSLVQGKEILEKTFNTSLSIYFIIGLIFLLLIESFGTYFIRHELNIPLDRINSAFKVFQISVLSTLITIITVPFNALIISYERLRFYSMLSIADTLLKLVLIYFLINISYDKLELYSILLIITSGLNSSILIAFCLKKIIKFKIDLRLDKSLFKEIINFTSWNLLGNFVHLANQHGSNVLMNIFFNTIINAAKGISMTVSLTIQSFIGNIQVAANPQIIKLYHSSSYTQLNNLILLFTKISFYATMLITLPLILETKLILDLWLINPPEYSYIFTKLALIDILIFSLTGSLVTVVLAYGKIRNYQIIVSAISFINLPITYILYKLDYPAHVYFITGILFNVLCIWYRIIFIENKVKINLKKFKIDVIARGILIVCIIVLIRFFLNSQISLNLTQTIILNLIISIFSVLIIYLIGLTKEEKIKTKKYIKTTLNEYSNINTSS